jgi:hypothetical protein
MVSLAYHAGSEIVLGRPVGVNGRRVSDSII